MNEARRERGNRDEPSDGVVGQTTILDVFEIPGDDVRSSRSDDSVFSVSDTRIKSGENHPSARIHE